MRELCTSLKIDVRGGIYIHRVPECSSLSTSSSMTFSWLLDQQTLEGAQGICLDKPLSFWEH